MNPIKKVELIEASLSQFEDVYRCLLEDFPIEEVKGYGQLEGLLAGGHYKLLLAIEPIMNEMVGYAFIYVFEDIPAIWLDYLAINPRLRGTGIGSLVLTQLAQYKNNETGIFIEVEKPKDQPGSKRDDQLSRIRFYERFGAKRMPISYELPTDEGGFSMYLYYKPAENHSPFTTVQIQMAIGEIFQQIHSDVKDQNVILKRILSSFGE
jgi:ribosomal protein S18 acetylase RimI-like enzyme